MTKIRKNLLDKFRDIDLLKDTFALVDAVSKNGEEEILKYYKKKNINRRNIFVLKPEIESSLSKLSSRDIATLKRFKKQVNRLALKEKKGIAKKIVLQNDKYFQSIIQTAPLNSIGIYIPTNLPSSLILYCELARVAGVKHIALALPPRKDGTINPGLLAAASLCHVDMILAVGGRNAFPALAFGLGGRIPDKLFGPCSFYVDHVKQVLSTFYKIPIDIPAGPSELLIYIDNEQKIEQVEYDIRAQMEHGRDSVCFVISSNKKILDSLSQRTIDIHAQVNYFLVNDKKEVGKMINDVAPEILEIFSQDTKDIIADVQSCGNVYVNMCSPLGDYCFSGKGCADPTYGMARSISGITIASFLKTNCINISKKISQKDYWITHMPEMEGFVYHKKAIEKHFE